VSTIDCHKNGFISALTWANGTMWSGGKDGQVCNISSDLVATQ